MAKYNRGTNKKMVVLAAVVLVAALGFYFYNKKEAKAPVVESQTQNTSAQNLAQPSPTIASKTGTQTKQSASGPGYSPGQYSAGDAPIDGGTGIQVVEVDYTGAAFVPSSVSIHLNDYVFFKNKSTVDFWPATGPHPMDNAYPAFNSGKPIAPGKEFKFQFTRLGSWSYHNHLNETQMGVVNVVK